jgi:hypothetical protein
MGFAMINAPKATLVTMQACALKIALQTLLIMERHVSHQPSFEKVQKQLLVLVITTFL